MIIVVTITYSDRLVGVRTVKKIPPQGVSKVRFHNIFSHWWSLPAHSDRLFSSTCAQMELMISCGPWIRLCHLLLEAINWFYFSLSSSISNTQVNSYSGVSGNQYCLLWLRYSICNVILELGVIFSQRNFVIWRESSIHRCRCDNCNYHTS